MGIDWKDRIDNEFRSSNNIPIGILDTYYFNDISNIIIKLAKEVHDKACMEQKTICSNIHNHKDAFYENGTWWIPCDSIMKQPNSEFKLKNK